MACFSCINRVTVLERISLEAEKEILPEDLGEEYEVPTFLRQGKKKLIN